MVSSWRSEGDPKGDDEGVVWVMSSVAVSSSGGGSS